MSTDQSLAVAANALCVIAYCAPKPISATFIAEQISLHPVVVRRNLGKLVSANLVQSSQGMNGGYVLARAPEEISLQDVFRAISDKGVFARSNAFPQANCSEGERIGIVITEEFAKAEHAFASVLEKTSIAQILQRAEKV